MTTKVSVCIDTYNHEKYIAQAIESVLMQRTNFDFELVIGEDCSQDKTAEIVASYARRYPHRIRALLGAQNLGPNRNFRRIHQSCRGEYVAFLNGDDYWLSPDKLQKQVDFMEAHPECSGCCHPVKILWETTGKVTIQGPKYKKDMYTLEDYGNHFIAAHSSAFFRRALLQLPDWFIGIRNGDLVLQILHVLHGPIGFIDEVLGVYRVHPGGIWYGGRASERAGLESNVHTIEQVLAHLQPRNKSILMRRLCQDRYNLAHCLCNEGDSQRAREYASKCVREVGYDFRISPLEPIQIYAHIYVQPLYRLFKAAKRLVRKGHRRLGTISNHA